MIFQFLIDLKNNQQFFYLKEFNLILNPKYTFYNEFERLILI